MPLVLMTQDPSTHVVLLTSPKPVSIHVEKVVGKVSQQRILGVVTCRDE